MELVITPAPGWRQVQLPEQTLIAAPSDGGGEPDTALGYVALLPLPQDARAWAQTVLGVELGDCRLGPWRTSKTTTGSGYQVEIVEADVFGPGDLLVEVRLGAFYRFLEWAGAVLARSVSRASFEKHKDAIMSMVRDARPDFGGRVMCLHDLFDGVAVDPALEV